MEKYHLQEIDSNAVGNRISDLIDRKGYTKKAVADMLGITPQAVNKWIYNAESLPDLQHIVDLSTVLDCTTDYLLKGDEPP